MIRPYAQLSLTTIMLYYSFWRWKLKPGNKELIFWLFMVALTCFTHLLGLYIMLALGVYYVWDGQLKTQSFRENLRFFLFTLLAIGVGSTWVFLEKYSFASFGGIKKLLIPPFDFLIRAMTHSGPSNDLEMRMHDFLRSPILKGVLGYIGLNIFGLHFVQKENKSLMKFLISISLIPVIILYITLGTGYYWEWSRYMSYVSIGTTILAVLGIRFFFKKWKMLGVSFAAIILILSLSPGFYKISKGSPRWLRNWVTLITTIPSHARKVQGIIIESNVISSRPYQSDNLPMYIFGDQKKQYCKVNFKEKWRVKLFDPDFKIEPAPKGDYL